MTPQLTPCNECGNPLSKYSTDKGFVKHFNCSPFVNCECSECGGDLTWEPAYGMDCHKECLTKRIAKKKQEAVKPWMIGSRDKEIIVNKPKSYCKHTSYLAAAKKHSP